MITKIIDKQPLGGAVVNVEDGGWEAAGADVGGVVDGDGVERSCCNNLEVADDWDVWAGGLFAGGGFDDIISIDFWFKFSRKNIYLSSQANKVFIFTHIDS